MSVSQAQEEINSAEFCEWLAFAEIEPFGEARADLRAGIIAATVANALSSGRKNYSASDFMPDFSGEKKEQSRIEEMKARIQMAAAWSMKNGNASKSIGRLDSKNRQVRQGLQEGQPNG
jgi:hypothetical protein